MGLGSIFATIAGGLILNVISGLTRLSWLAFVVAVVVVATGITLARRHGSRELLEAHIGGGAAGRVRISLATILLSGMSVILLASALGLSVYSSATSNQEHFVQLWIVPIPAGGGSTEAAAEVGVANYEGHRDRFEVSVVVPGSVVLKHEQVVLGEGQSWDYDLVRKGLVPVVATVSFASRPTKILCSVRLASPVLTKSVPIFHPQVRGTDPFDS
jgi:hypothetical protein